MASHPPRRTSNRLDELLAGSPPYWLGLWVLAAPWMRFTVGSWTLYPGHLALGALLAAVLLSEPGWTAALRPLAPLLALGGYLAGVSALRGEWQSALALAGLTALHFCWGAAAMRVGMGAGGGAVRESLLGLLAASLLMGVVAWAAQAWWPPACRVLNCAEDALAPYPFTGGWERPDRFLLLLLFLAPPMGGLLLTMLRGTRSGRTAWQVAGLLGAAGLGLLAGATVWTLALVGLGWLLTYRALSSHRGRTERTLLQALAVAGVFGFILVFGLEPGYLQRLWAGQAAPPAVRVALPGAPPRGLSSDAAAPLTLLLTNTGWRTLQGSAEGPLTLTTHLLVTPEHGTTRTAPGITVPIEGALQPGEPRSVQMLVQVPHWVRDGYLTWELRTADGRLVPATRDSQPGFRFINAGYRRLGLDAENQLTALAARSRAFEHRTAPPPASDYAAHAPGLVLGDVLDTVFFSPLWGQPAPDGVPFAAPRAVLPALTHHYGLIGLALALWFAFRLFRRSLACGDPNDPAWLLAPISVLLLALAGLLTPAVASYHAHWAFFLLAGYLEGQYARKFPWPRLQVAPRRAGPLGRRIRIPLAHRFGMHRAPGRASGR